MSDRPKRNTFLMDFKMRMIFNMTSSYVIIPMKKFSLDYLNTIPFAIAWAAFRLVPSNLQG